MSDETSDVDHRTAALRLLSSTQNVMRPDPTPEEWRSGDLRLRAAHTHAILELAEALRQRAD